MRLRLKLAIILKNISQTQFAAKCGRDKHWLSRIIVGRQDPTDDERRMIMEKLQVYDEDLFKNER